MPKLTEDLLNAQILANFANLQPKGVTYFRNNYPDFAPSSWWDEDGNDADVRDTTVARRLHAELMDKLTREVVDNGSTDEAQLREKSREIEREVSNLRLKQWQITQDYLRKWWRSGFKDDVRSLTILLASVFDPGRVGIAGNAEWVVRQVYPIGVPEDVVIHMPGRSLTSESNLRTDYIPLQGAIVYLFTNSWRVRFCAECGKHFVAAQSKTKFCTENCSHENRNRQKRKSWHAHKKEWRPARLHPATRAAKRHRIKE